MRLTELLSLDPGRWNLSRSPFRAVPPRRAPYLHEVRPINLDPVRPVLGDQTPCPAPASPSLGRVEKLFFAAMISLSIVFSAYLVVGELRVTHARKEAGLASQLHRVEQELSETKTALRALEAKWEALKARELELADVRVVAAAAPPRRTRLSH